MSEGRRGGERRRPTLAKRRHRTQARVIVAGVTGRVLRSVLRPARAIKRRRRYRGWANLGQPGRNHHRGHRGWARRGSPHATAFARKRRGVSEPEGDRGLRPSEDRQPGFGCPHVVEAVAKVVRRRLASNKLGKRAPKRAAGSSERGPSSNRGGGGSNRRRAGRAKGTSRFGLLPARKGEDRTKTQGGARAPFSGRLDSPQGAETVAGPGL